ncbi:hypothetical protein Gotri_007245 [Gossypium trilobum]|uniref:Uncharacterized protein n=1 Tax=Gossypium trilobum TaxID=34281 RepID=A0A7J9EG02_9ROSI|nr:hypothetical protein [Gossypium trilobum]
MRSSIKVSGVNVLVIKISICQFYDAPYYYRDYLYKTDLKELKDFDTKEILRILMEGKEIWTYWKGTAIPETFNQALMMPKTKIWMKNVVECTRTLEKGIFFPHLVIDLYKRAGVPTE